MESKGLKAFSYVFVQWSSPNRKLITQFPIEESKHKFCDLTSNIVNVNPHDWKESWIVI